MELNELLFNIFKELGIEVAQDEYLGKQGKYATFTYYDEQPTSWADNEVTSDTAYLQIQFVTPKNYDYFAEKKAIRNALEDNGFIIINGETFLGDVYSGTEKKRTCVWNVKYTEMRGE